MKHLLLTSYLLFFCGISVLHAQVVQFDQTFDANGYSNWNYTINPATYNTQMSPIVSGSDDVWGIVQEFTNNIDNPNPSDLFFGGQDLNNPNGGGDFYHTITFDAIDVSDFTDMTLSFEYFSKGFDTTDDIKYEILLDNTTPFADNSSNDPFLVGGTDLNKNTLAWSSVFTPIPDGTSFVRLRIKVYQNGASDYIGINNIQLMGTDTTLSIDSITEKPVLNIFPNPTTDFITITGLNKTATFKIYSTLGKEIVRGTVSNNETITTQNLKNGLYFLKFEDGNTIKFIKK